jgi:predicted MFS family arabinose efflux permease
MNPLLRPAMPILLGIAIMLSLSMGMRQSLGLFMTPATQDLGIAVAEFTLAIAVQNLGWGLVQPFVGAAAARWGFRPVLVVGSVSYVAGLGVMATAQGSFGLLIGAGLLIGLALSCTGSGMALAVAARPVPASLRSTALGIVSAIGAAGALFAAPLGQLLSEGWGWRAGLAGFFLIGLAMVPAAWIAGRVDRLPVPPLGRGESARMGPALAKAMTHLPFLVMAGAYLVCGLQLVFLTTHLPSYLALCGQDPMLSAKALGLIGAFNIVGSIFFGWAGGRWNKGALLGGMYMTRSLVIALYFLWPPSEASTLFFASIMGFLWLGVAPLISGMVVDMFGLRFQAMIQGIAFMSHQIGSFLGALGGGVLFDLKGDYVLAWQLGVGMGLFAGAVQLAFALGAPRPPRAEPRPQPVAA